MGIFCSCCYISSDRFLVGSHKGKISFYLNEGKTHQKKYHPVLYKISPIKNI